MKLIDAVIQINEKQPAQNLALLKKLFPSLEGRQISVLGLAFKPGTDDMRESPAIPIVKDLLLLGAQIKAHDPVAKDEAQKIFGNRNIAYCNDLMEAIKDAEAIVVLTRWEQYKDITDLLSQLNQSPVVIDGRRMLDKSILRRYEGIGL